MFAEVNDKDLSTKQWIDDDEQKKGANAYGKKKYRCVEERAKISDSL